MCLCCCRCVPAAPPALCSEGAVLWDNSRAVTSGCDVLRADQGAAGPVPPAQETPQGCLSVPGSAELSKGLFTPCIPFVWGYLCVWFVCCSQCASAPWEAGAEPSGLSGSFGLQFSQHRNQVEPNEASQGICIPQFCPEQQRLGSHNSSSSWCPPHGIPGAGMGAAPPRMLFEAHRAGNANVLKEKCPGLSPVVGRLLLGVHLELCAAEYHQAEKYRNDPGAQEMAWEI